MFLRIRKLFLLLILTVSIVYWMLLLNFKIKNLHTRKLDFLESNYTFRDFQNSTCSESRNFVFIKCMKCATETMGTILRRFGYVRDLSFVLPIKRNLYLGWPFPLEQTDVKPSSFGYNILMEHSIYTPNVSNKFMPNNTKYISIIRSPWEHLKSAFNYFDLGGVVGVPNRSYTNFLENIEFYSNKYMSHESRINRMCIADGFRISKNLMSHCLGMPLGFPLGTKDISNNTHEIEEYIAKIDREFSLIMIADHFTESLVMLKRTMCWKFKDILYHYSNVGNYKSAETKDIRPEGRYLEIHKNWSAADYLLFNHFNKTFWNKVKREGPGFVEEVEHFRLIQMLVERFCFVENNWSLPESVLQVPGSRFEAAFNVTGEDCVLMSTYMLPMLWARYYEKEGLEPEGKAETPPERGCSI